MKKYIISSGIALMSIACLASTALASFMPPPPPGPTSADQCKHDGWRSYGDMFKNQGDCVSFVVTNGNNPPDGPPISQN